MSPRDARLSAVPEVEMARLDSDLHHLRDQADLDRRTEATFRTETREQLQRIDATQASTAGQLMRVSDLVNRIDVSQGKHEIILTDMTATLNKQQGAIWIVGALAAAAPLIVEVCRHVFK